ncbi:MAG: HAD family hydrolase, partial [Pirellulales bacterium]|nr:HAD family hydrolase [Pirellulales bacterium]
PEVDIVKVWRDACENLSQQGILEIPPESADFARLAIEFEVRTNPVWPMPGLAECFGELRSRGTVMGIISNAQFFTPLLFPAVLEQSLDDLGFAANLRYYSYMHGLAKPGSELYTMAAEGLDALDIEPGEVLYVGNDMRNDIWPAQTVGFRTALFAGDRRSLRMREQDERRAEYGQADAIVTSLEQIPALIDNRD